MASSSLAAPRKRIAQAFRNLVDEFRSFGAEFKSRYESAIAEQMGKFQELDGLEPSDKKRIRIAVEDAARCNLSTQWGYFFFEVIKYRFRIMALMGIVATPLLVGLLYLLPKPSIPNISKSVIASAFPIGLLLLLLPMLFRKSSEVL
jgi:hypothetical protein